MRIYLQLAKIDPVGPWRGARITATATQNYSVTGAYTPVRFPTLDKDTGGFYDPTKPNKFTVPAGVSKVRLSASLKVDATDTIESNTFQFGKNGVKASTSFSGNGVAALGSGGYNNPGGTLHSAVLDVVPGDVLELYYFASGSFSLNGDRGLTWFQIEAVEVTAQNTKLRDMLDVSTVAPTEGQVPIWNAAQGKFVFGTPVVAANAAQGMYKPFRGASVYRNANLAAAAPIVPFPWEAAEYDTNGFWNSGQPGRFTVPAGVKKIRLSTVLAIGVGGGITANDGAIVHFVKNGASEWRGAARADMRAAYGDLGVATTSPVLAVQAGDYFEVRFNTPKTGTLTFDAARCMFTLEVIEAEETLA